MTILNQDQELVPNIDSEYRGITRRDTSVKETCSHLLVSIDFYSTTRDRIDFLNLRKFVEKKHRYLLPVSRGQTLHFAWLLA